MFSKPNKAKEAVQVQSNLPQPEITDQQKSATSAVSQTQISSNSSINGDLNIGGDLLVDGEITGRIKVCGHLIVGKKGVIRSESVECTVGEVSGRVEGKISAFELLVIHNNGHVAGDIEVKDIIIEKGGRFDGKCQYITSEASTSPVNEPHKPIKDKADINIEPQ